MVAVAIVLIGGWLLASVIGSWAYFAGRPEAEISPFHNYQKQIYQRLYQQRQARLRATSSRSRNLETARPLSSSF